MGVESRNDYSININPGLGFGSEAGNEFLGRMIELYKTFHFLKDDGTPYLKNIVQITTEELLSNGLQNREGIQECCGFTIYPNDYFCPIDYDTRELRITSNTRTIHHYAESWVPKSVIFKNWLRRIFGQHVINFLIKAKRRIVH